MSTSNSHACSVDEVAERAAQRICENDEAPLHPHGCGSEHLLSYNKKWAAAIRHKNPQYFESLASGQSPKFFFLACCDSRVVPTELLGLLPGEAFVHRSVASLVSPDDLNVMAAAQYAVHHLKVHTVVVTGHHRCGGIAATYKGSKLGYAEDYLKHVALLRDKYKKRIEAEVRGSDIERIDAFVEISVIHQALNLARTPVMQSIWDAERSRSSGGGGEQKSAGRSAQTVELLGWVLVLPKGTIRPLLRMDAKTDIDKVVEEAIEAVFTRYNRPPHLHVADNGDGVLELVGLPRPPQEGEEYDAELYSTSLPCCSASHSEGEK